jgi:hypothetical protein
VQLTLRPDCCFLRSHHAYHYAAVAQAGVQGLLMIVSVHPDEKGKPLYIQWALKLLLAFNLAEVRPRSPIVRCRHADSCVVCLVAAVPHGVC